MRKSLSNMEYYNFDNTYEADEQGQVWSTKTGNKIKPFINRYGYVEYVLTNKDKTKKHIQAHRIVACLFIPLDKTRVYVNHKDGDKKNNTINNLEWCTVSENEVHSVNTLGKEAWNKGIKLPSGLDYAGPIRTVLRFDLEGNFEKEYFNPTLAEKDGYIAKQISAVCKGNQQSHKGKFWQYLDDSLNKPPRKPKRRTPGVSLRKDTGKYTARLTYNKKVYRLGCFKTEKEAIEARNNFIKNNPDIQVPLIKDI